MYKMRLKTSAFAMSYISNEEKVRDMVRGLDIPLRRQPLPNSHGGDMAGAVLFSPERYKNLGDYVAKMDSYVSAPASRGCAMIAFPELCGMTVMSLMPGFSALYSDLVKLKKASPEAQSEALFSVCEAVQGFVGEIFLNTFSQLARSHRMVIAAGGMYQLENGKLYNRQFMFNESGDAVGIQNKLFLSPTERRLGVTAGERITPAVTRFGRVALLGGSVLSHYEPFWISAAMGCRYAVAGASPFVVPEHRLAPCRAQESGMCILSPGLTGGGGYGMSLSAPAGIYAPKGLVESADGIAAMSSEEPAVTARVDMTRLNECFDLYSADKNIRFFRALISPPEPEKEQP